MRGLNPLSRLPGNVEVQEQVSKRVAEGAPFALLYIDLDNFKAFNDHYGFLRGDEAIKLLASCSRDALDSIAGNGGFLGHIGGDDLVAIIDPEAAETMAKDLIQRWDEVITGCYDPEDAERGYIEVEDRKGSVHRYPMTTVSIGIATDGQRAITSCWEASEIASEMKQFAKRDPHSSYSIDRRRDPSATSAPRNDSGAKT
jgi:diguanylate cyclase (GGDEF)-like protein